MFAVKAKIYEVVYNQSSSIAFDETSSYWSAPNLSAFHRSPRDHLISIGGFISFFSLYKQSHFGCFRQIVVVYVCFMNVVIFQHQKTLGYIPCVRSFSYSFS